MLIQVPGEDRLTLICPTETRGVQGRDCMLCGGAQVAAKSIVITAHGSGKVHLIKRAF